MKKLLSLLFIISLVNGNAFKIKNDLFEVEGNSDNNNIITYAKLTKCNLAEKSTCEELKKLLKSIPLKNQAIIISRRT